MKKKIIILFVVLVIVIGLVVFFKTRKSTNEEEVSYKDVTVSTQDIENTLTSSGEVTSNTITKSLNTNKYFEDIYYEEGEYIKKGAKIVKYTDGTYYKAPYNLVLVGYNLPDEDERITGRNYLQVKGMKTLRMTLTIDESEIKKVSKGLEVNITMNAIEGTTYTGKITYINQEGSYSSSGTKYTATVKFTNDGQVMLGMSGTVSIVLESVKNAIAVPIEAIQTQGDNKYVVVVDGNNTSNVTVETGISNAAYVEIKSGLSGGETIRMIETSTSTTSNRRFNNSGGSGKNGEMTRPSGDFVPGQRN